MAQETALGLKLSSKPTNSRQVIFSRAFLPLDDWPNATVELANNMVATTAVVLRFRSILLSLVIFLWYLFRASNCRDWRTQRLCRRSMHSLLRITSGYVDEEELEMP